MTGMAFRLPGKALRLTTIALLAALASLAAKESQAKPATFVMEVSYSCLSAPSPPGCNPSQQQTTLIAFTADDTAVTDLTAQGGGKGYNILDKFSIGTAAFLASADTNVACSDGKALGFDPTVIANTGGGKTYRNGFSCSNIVITNSGVNLTLVNSAPRAASITGTTGQVQLFGNIQLDSTPHTVTRTFSVQSLTFPEMYIQNRWDSCQYSGFDSGAPVDSGQADGCVLQAGGGGAPNVDWVLKTKRPPSPAILVCYAICQMSK
jgi:hypothetical protein